MIFAIEAVRYGDDGLIESVRWHSIDVTDSGLKKGASEVVDAQTAMKASVEDAVHICHHGAPASTVGVGKTPRGVTLVDRATTPKDQLLDQLPRF